FYRWVRSFESKGLSLPSELNELENQVYMARKRSIERQPSSEMTELERLRDENQRLRKALNEVLNIGREQYGIDLLKKSWRQAVDNLRLRHSGASIGCLSGLFCKSREGYYAVSGEKRMRKELSESEVVTTVREIGSCLSASADRCVYP
ncbi:MAG: hypothetical protein MR387_02145, partial [Phocaeicola plebeius]|nr:hypothetical protein [Phocaeicola plebeius]